MDIQMKKLNQTQREKIEKHILSYINMIDDRATDIKVEVRDEYGTISFKGDMNGFVFQRLHKLGFTINSIGCINNEVKFTFKLPEILGVL